MRALFGSLLGLLILLSASPLAPMPGAAVQARLEASGEHAQHAVQAFQQGRLRDAQAELQHADRALDAAVEVNALRGAASDDALDAWRSLLRLLAAHMAAETLAERALEALPDAARADEHLAEGWNGPLAALRAEVARFAALAARAPPEADLSDVAAQFEADVEALTEKYVLLGLLVQGLLASPPQALPQPPASSAAL